MLPKPASATLSPPGAAGCPLQPVVFLDIDGVLNLTKVAWRTVEVPRSRGPGRPGKPGARKLVWEREFRREPVQQLDRLLEQTRASLVLSSSWRLQLGVRTVLEGFGVQGPWHEVWRTDDLDGGRGAQIERWLAANGRPRHVILDDWPHELHGHWGQVVLTNNQTGLTRELANEAREKLHRQRYESAVSPQASATR
ncbi:HAD domain-containing protein [Sphingomonas bacterium]|uniref:HAD domain-containing protein n=1 Tax=Sphingomonas bacterium TaxID=1895847 RepID=UPI0034A0AC3F